MTYNGRAPAMALVVIGSIGVAVFACFPLAVLWIQLQALRAKIRGFKYGELPPPGTLPNPLDPPPATLGEPSATTSIEILDPSYTTRSESPPLKPVVAKYV
jgi:hypothetical protein